MTLEAELEALNVSDWKTDKAVVFDWHDGPRQGVCRLRTPQVEFAFEIVAERLNPNGLDDRLFRLSEIHNGAVEQVLELTKSLGEPSGSVWVPVWKFPTDEEMKRADSGIDMILGDARPSSIVIRSLDFRAFSGCWNVSQLPRDGEDWFDFLGMQR